MLEAAYRALAQMASPEFRRVLYKSLALALILIVLFGIGLHRLFYWAAEYGADWAEATTGVVPHTAWSVLLWVISIAAALGIVTGAVFLMPAVTAFIGSFFVDEIGAAVERTYYPTEIPGKELPLSRALYEGTKTALVSVLVYLVTVPFLLFAGLGLVMMFLASAYLLGREYFLLAAMRFRSPEEAKAMRRANRTTVFLAGMLIALFVIVPIVNLATPLFAMALMVHMHKRLSGTRIELIEPKRASS
jgi:CysZ protein